MLFFCDCVLTQNAFAFGLLLGRVSSSGLLLAVVTATACRCLFTAPPCCLIRCLTIELTIFVVTAINRHGWLEHEDLSASSSMLQPICVRQSESWVETRGLSTPIFIHRSFCPSRTEA
ncbi:hypothetical protein Bca101_071141 [Brassica carinata]